MKITRLTPRQILIVLHDLLATAAAIIATFFLRFEGAALDERLHSLGRFLLAFLVYAVTVQHVGYLIATLVVLLLLMRAFGGMSWTRSLIIAVPSIILSYLAFSKLGVPLPSGVLPF